LVHLGSQQLGGSEITPVFTVAVRAFENQRLECADYSGESDQGLVLKRLLMSLPAREIHVLFIQNFICHYPAHVLACNRLVHSAFDSD